MRKITLDGWVLFSDRSNSQNYISSDGTLMLKVGTEKNRIDVKDFKRQIFISENLIKMGIPTPKVVEIVDVLNKGPGVIFEYVKDKISISRAISQDFDKLDFYVDKFVKLSKTLHNTPCNKKNFISIEEKIECVISKFNLLTDKEVVAVHNFLKTVPTTTTCLHGDYHFANVITAPSGDYFIDTDMFSYGHPYYDIGMLYIFTHCSPPSGTEKIFHMDLNSLLKCWKSFVKFYFGIEEENELLSFEKEIIPYGVLCFLSHIYQTDNPKYPLVIKKKFFDEAFKEYFD